MAAPSKPALLAFLPFCFTFHSLAQCTTQEVAGSAMSGRPFSLSWETGEPSRSPHTVQILLLDGANSITSQRHQGERDHAGHVIQSLEFIISVTTECLWGTSPAVYFLSTMASTGLRNSIL